MKLTAVLRSMLAAIAALSAFTIASAGTASAAVHVSPDVALALCESSAPSLCVRDSGGTEFTDTFSNATLVKFNPNGGTFTWNGVTYDTGTLNEPSESPACLGFNGINNINRQNCDTGTGIIWGHGSSNGHDVWVNRKKTQDNNVLTVLAASGSVNQPLFTSTWPPASGVFERWGFA